ncbi:hypothetical protein AB0323_00240 [Arthrobacter sp. NPDC080031]|uniref:hypothetical protein n=1 Tax=Arthrobacter sp. NPDC080031 TaxID=3155918 RepID=UPI00344C3524
MSEDQIHVAIMNLLWPLRGLERQAFSTILTRLPANCSPVISAPFGKSAPYPGFYGDAEITFESAGQLDSFVAALDPLMEDEQNVEKTISYQSTGPNTRTLIERSGDDSPNGDLLERRRSTFSTCGEARATPRYSARLSAMPLRCLRGPRM